MFVSNLHLHSLSVRVSSLVVASWDVAEERELAASGGS
jgi:hypothetical protein